MVYQHTCNFCGSDDWKELFTTTDSHTQEPDLFSILQCRKCGLHITFPLIDVEDYPRFYPDTYFSYDQVAFQLPKNGPGALLRKIVGDRYHYIFPPFQKGQKVFEIGCHKGVMLKELQQLGWQVSGLEINPKAAEFARQQMNLDVMQGDFYTADISENSYDLVLAMMVLEHLSDTQQALLKVNKILKPGGQFIFNIPNHNSLGRRLFGRHWTAYDIPRHFYHFDANILDKFLAKAGFKMEKVYYQKVPSINIKSTQNYIKSRNLNNRFVKRIEAFLDKGRKSSFILFFPFSFMEAIFRTSGSIIVQARVCK